MNVCHVCSRWLLSLFEPPGSRPVSLRGDTVLDERDKLRFPFSHRGWDGEEAPVISSLLRIQACGDLIREELEYIPMVWRRDEERWGNTGRKGSSSSVLSRIKIRRRNGSHTSTT